MIDIHPHILSMLDSYDLEKDDIVEALREILQEIVLYTLAQEGFFKHAVFYGGTALRILYKLPRFSEDLDFSLIKPDDSFSLAIYEDAIVKTLKEYGFESEVQTKVKDHTAIQSAFVKGNTLTHLIAINAPDHFTKSFHSRKQLKIKFEVDTQPPINFEDENKLLLKPIAFNVRTMTTSSLFAGKMHAVLCRGWSSRPKGRDWYDLVWYVQQGFEVDLFHLATRITQSCKAFNDANEEIPCDIKMCTKEVVWDMLKKRIESLDIESAKDDVKRFIRDTTELEIWSKEFFLQISSMIKFKEH